MDTANVTLGAGSLKGNVYLGGRVLEDGANTKGVAKATVGAGTLTIYKDFNFLKADAVIDGSGAESATLNFVNGYDFSKAEASEVALLDLPARIVIKGFDKLDSGDLVTMTWVTRPASRSPAITSLVKSSMVPSPRR